MSLETLPCQFCRAVITLSDGAEWRPHDEVHSRSCAQLQIARALDTSNALLREILETLKHGSSEARQPGGPELRPSTGGTVILTDHYCRGGQYIYPGCAACNPRPAPTDARPAEPAAAADASADDVCPECLGKWYHDPECSRFQP